MTIKKHLVTEHLQYASSIVPLEITPKRSSINDRSATIKTEQERNLAVQPSKH